MSWDSKAKYRIYRIYEEVEDWDRAKRKGWNYTARRSKRQLNDWLKKSRNLLSDTEGNRDLRASLEAMVLIGELTYDGELSVSTALSLFKSKSKMAAWFEEYAQQKELEAIRAGEEFAAFIKASDDIDALITEYREGKGSEQALYSAGLALYDFMNRSDIVVLSQMLTPIPGATETEWRFWIERVARSRALLAEWETSKLRKDELQEEYTAALVARAKGEKYVAPDPRISLENAIAAMELSPTIDHKVGLQRALVRARNKPGLEDLVGEADDLLSVRPHGLVNVRSYIAEHPFAVVGVSLSAIAGAIWAVTKYWR